MTSLTLDSITFTPTPDDYAAVYSNVLTKSTKSVRLKAVGLLILASYGATFTTLMIASAVTPQSAIAAAVCCSIFMWVFAIRTWISPEKQAKLRYNPKENPSFFRARTLQLEEMGIRHRSEHSDLWYNWNVVRQITITSEHLLFVCGTSTFFVPSRAFSSQESFIAFARIAQARYAPPQDTTKPEGFEVILKPTPTRD